MNHVTWHEGVPKLFLSSCLFILAQHVLHMIRSCKWCTLKLDNGLQDCNSLIHTWLQHAHSSNYYVLCQWKCDFKSVVQCISGAPENTQLSVHGPRELEMIWSTPRNDSRDGYFENFQVICVTGTNRNIVYSNLIEDRHASGDVIVQGITPHTGYNCCVLMTTSEGSSPYSCAAAMTDQDSKSFAWWQFHSNVEAHLYNSISV